MRQIWVYHHFRAYWRSSHKGPPSPTPSFYKELSTCQQSLLLLPPHSSHHPLALISLCHIKYSPHNLTTHSYELKHIYKDVDWSLSRHKHKECLVFPFDSESHLLWPRLPFILHFRFLVKAAQALSSAAGVFESESSAGHHEASQNMVSSRIAAVFLLLNSFSTECRWWPNNAFPLFYWGHISK